MLYWLNNFIHKLLNTKSHTGKALFKSLAQPVWDFVLLTNQTLMKKYLYVFVLCVLLVPSLVFASWYNPLSWDIFHKTQTLTVSPTINTEPIKTPDEKIPELKSHQLTSTSTVKIVKKTPVQTSIPVVSTPVITPLAPTPPPFDACENIEGIQTIVPDGTYPDGDGNCLPIVANPQIQQAPTQNFQTKAQIDSQNDALQAKQAKLNAVNLQIATLNAKRASDIAKAYANPYVTEQGADNEVDQINKQYFVDYDTLQAQYQLIEYGN